MSKEIPEEYDVCTDPSYEVNYLLKNVKDMSDLYFLILLVLGKMEGSNKNSMLAELSYLLDSQSFLNLIWYFEGQTIRIPTREEVKDMLQLMSIYYHYNILGKTWKDSMKESGIDYEVNLSRRTWTKYKKFIKSLEDVKLPKKLRMPSADDKLKMEGIL